MPGNRTWTPKLSQEFYSSVNRLTKKLNGQGSPRQSQDYRLEKRNSLVDERYTLPYEEELHLADHFAFLAHAFEGVEYVSAVTLEEAVDESGFKIRLASNHTPIQPVVEGLERILEIVRQHANEGMLT